MKKYMTIRETAKELELTETYIRRLARTEGIPGFKSGNRVYVDVEAFKESMSTRRVKMGKEA